MKCAAMRLGEEFHDLDDVRYLLRHLDISSVDEALDVVFPINSVLTLLVVDLVVDSDL